MAHERSTRPARGGRAPHDTRRAAPGRPAGLRAAQRLAVCLLLLSCGAAVAQEAGPPAPALHVASDGSGDFADLAAALAAAPDGARLVVDGGPWPVALRLERPVVIEGGRSRPVLRGATADQPALVVASEGVVLRRLVLQGHEGLPAESAAGSDEPPSGGRAETDGAAAAETLPFDPLTGVAPYLPALPEAPSLAPVVRVEAGSVRMERCALATDGRPGLVAEEGARVELVESAVTCGLADGVRVAGGARLVLRSGEVARCRIGVLVEGGEAELLDARVARCGVGLSVTAGGRARLQDGVVWTNALDGIVLGDGATLSAHGSELKAPGGAPAVRVARGGVADLSDCTLLGTPAEADHHAGPVTREDLASPVRAGTDHHLLTGLLWVEAGGDASVRGGRIAGSLGHGVLVAGGAARLVDVSVEGSVFYNVFVEGGEARLERCRIENAGENGFFAWRGAGGEVVGCTFAGNGTSAEDGATWAAIVLSDGAHTAFRDCTVDAGRGAGAVVSGGLTAGTFERCTLRDGGGIGFVASAGARPVLSACTIDGFREQGLLVTRGAQVDVTGGAITACRGGGVRVDEGGRARLAGVTLSGHRGAGVSVRRGAELRLHGGEITRNDGPGAQAAWTGRLLLSRTRVTGNTGPALHVHDDGRATLQAADLAGNHQPPEAGDAPGGGTEVPDGAATTSGSGASARPEIVVETGGVVDELDG